MNGQAKASDDPTTTGTQLIPHCERYGEFGVRTCTSDSDYSAWDRFLFRLPGAHYFQTYGWLKSYEPMGLEPHVLVRESEGTITGGVGFLSARVPLPLLRWRIVVIPHGPVPAAPNESWHKLMSAVDKFCEAHGAIYAQIYPHEKKGESLLLRTLEERGYTHPPLSTSHRFSSTPVLVPLAGRTEEEILSGLRKKTRQYVRRALNSELVLRREISDDMFDEIHQLLAENGELLGYRVRPYASLRAAWDWYAREDRATFLQAWLGDRLIGAILLVFTGRTAFYLAGAVRHGFQQHRPAEFLHWHGICESLRRGLDTYDLVNTSTAGVEQFKQGFRPAIHSWHAPRAKLYRPSAARIVSLTERLLRPAIRRVMRSLADRSGSTANRSRTEANQSADSDQ